MFVTVLFTVLSLCASCLASVMALLARKSADNAAHSEHRLAIMRGQVRGLEVSVAAVDDGLRKLRGRVYADQYWNGKREEQPELEPHVPHTDRWNDPTKTCDNWATAQREGPGSPAAGCECEYCNSRRADRAARRAKLRAGVKP